MKRIRVAILILLALTMIFATACNTENKEDKKSIVCTTFAQYDWTLELLGERAEQWNVELLVDNGADIHSYQPSYKDLLSIKQSDLFICNGGSGEEWATEIFEKNESDALVIEFISLPEIELLEIGGGNGHSHSEECSHGHDEHLWLSLENAIYFCGEIEKALSRLDAEGSEQYAENLEGYTAELKELSERYVKAVEQASFDTLIFADRYPFAYLVRDLGLNCYSAFKGCTTESQASLEMITSLAEKVDRLDLPALIVLEGSDCELAESVIARTEKKNQRIITLDSMQGVSLEDIRDGASYLKIMEKNLTALSDAIN